MKRINYFGQRRVCSLLAVTPLTTKFLNVVWCTATIVWHDTVNENKDDCWIAISFNMISVKMRMPVRMAPCY